MALLRSARISDGRVVDVRTQGGRIGEVASAGDLEPEAGEEIHDLTGYLLLAAPAEPHAHLDKAFTADRVANPTGDLPGAIDAWLAYRAGLEVHDILERARLGATRSLACGATAIRSHVDVGEGIELRGLDALIALKEELAALIPLQLVALVSRPLTGLEGANNRAFLRSALERGADLVGGAPHVDPEPMGALEFCVRTAAEFGRPLDLHMDENLDPGSLGLADLARLVAEGFPHSVTASHCVSLGIQPPATQVRVAEALASAGVSVVTLPQTNLYLQGRGWETSPPRALTALGPLLAAGVNVAAGGDNVQDVFNPLGRGDPLEAAGLLVSAGHLSTEQAYCLVSDGARRVMGLPPVEVAAGLPADLLAVAGASLREVLASSTEDRFVFAAGRLVARTRVERHMPANRRDLAVAAGSEALAWP